MYNKKVIIDAIRNLNKSKPVTKYNKAYTNNTTGKKKSDNVISAENGVNAPVFKSLSVGPSKIQGKGIFSQEPIAKDDVIGVSHIRKSFTKNGEQYQAPFPSVELGGYYNHSESPNIYEVDNGDHILMLAKRNINPGEELTSNYYNHNIKDLESPDNFKKGGSAKRPKIPNKKNSKAYSRSFEATNKFFAQNPLFSKPKSRKNKIFDPNAKYYADGGELIKAQNGLSHKERMQAYDDSLAVYNMYQDERNYFNKLFANYKPDLLSDKDVRRLDKWFNYYNNHNVPKDAIQRLKDLNKRKPYDKTPQRVYDKNTLKNGKYNIDKFVGNFPKPKKPIDSKAPSKVTKTQSSKVNQSPCSNPITTVVNNVPEKAPFGKKLVGTNSETLPVTGKKCEYVKTINPIYEDLKVEPIELGRFPERIDNGPLPSLQVNDYSLPDSIEAPQYTLDPYTDDRLRLSVTPGKSRRVTKSERLSGGQRYKHTEYKPTKDLKFGKKEVTKPIASLVQKLTGYDPAYFEGYEDEEGNFVPGELDYGNATGSEMEFRGAASLRDLINQQKYKKEYEEYDKNLDTWLEQYEQSKKKQAEGRAFKYGGLSKFLDGGPQCPEGYTYNPETKRCEGQRKDCPEGYDWDEQEGRCKSKAYREKSELYVKGNKVVPTEEQEKYPWWPDDLTIKNLEPRYNLIQPEKRLSIFKPGLSDTKYEWSPVEVEIYPDLNYQVVVDPNKPKGYNADKSIYYVPDENNFEFEKFKQYKKLKEIEKENLANLEKYPNLTTKTESGYNWEDAYLNPEYMPFSNKNKTFDEYKNIKKEEYEGCTDCTYGHGETISYDDDDRITEQNLAHVYNKFYDIPDYDTRFEREHDYIELSNDSVIPRLDLASSDVEAPTYAEGDPSMMMPHVRLDAGKTKSKKHSGRLIDGKGQRYKHTTYKQGKDLEFGKHEVNRLIPALVQKFTGYDPKYYQGYDKEVGDETEYVPGEIERAEQEGRKINFKGAATLRDLKKQKEYDRQWLEYQNQKDAVRQQNEAYLQEYDITPEEYEQYYGPFKNGGAKKKDLPKASFGLAGTGKDRSLTFTPFDYRSVYGQASDFTRNPNYSLTYTTPKLFKKADLAGNPLSFTLGRPYNTDAQSLTNRTLNFIPQEGLFTEYYDPSMQPGDNPKYQQYLQDVSNYTGTPVSGLNQTIINQYNAAKNLAGAKPLYKKGIPLTANVGWDVFGNAFGDASSGPFTGYGSLNVGYAPEPGFYGTGDLGIMGVFGRRKNNAKISPQRYFDKGLTRQGDMAFIPKLNVLNFALRQRPEYNDIQTQNILNAYANDIEQGTRTAESVIDKSDENRIDMSFLSPEGTVQIKPFKDFPGVASFTGGLRLDYGGKEAMRDNIPITLKPYGNVRYTVPIEGAIDKLKDLNLPAVKRKKTYNDYAYDQEYDEEYTGDTPQEDTPTENNFEINPPELQVNPNGTVLGRGDCPEGYERPCPKCRCQKLKQPQMYTDKRGTHLFGNEPIRFEDGGSIELTLSKKDIDKYVKGGYIVEDISVPTLTRKEGGELPKASSGLIKIAEKVPGLIDKLPTGWEKNIKKFTRSNYNPFGLLAKEIGYDIASQSHRAGRYDTDILEALKGPKHPGSYFGVGVMMGQKVPDHIREFYGEGKRDLNRNYFFGDETGFEPTFYDFESDAGLQQAIDWYGPLKAYELFSEIKGGEDLSIKSLLANIPDESRTSGPLVDLMQGYKNDNLFTSDEFKTFYDPSTGKLKLVDTSPYSPSEFEGLVKDNLNYLFDQYGQETIPFQVNASTSKEGELPSGFHLSRNPVNPYDDIQGHMKFVKRLSKDKFSTVTRDLWGFNRKAYMDKYNYENNLSPWMVEAMDAFGKPMVLTQENPIIFKQNGGAFEYEVGDEIELDDLSKEELERLGYKLEEVK